MSAIRSFLKAVGMFGDAQSSLDITGSAWDGRYGYSGNSRSCVTMSYDNPKLHTKIMSGLSAQTKSIIEEYHNSGIDTYFFGGIVRDTLLGRSPNDVDLVTVTPTGMVILPTLPTPPKQLTNSPNQPPSLAYGYLGGVKLMPTDSTTPMDIFPSTDITRLVHTTVIDQNGVAVNTRTGEVIITEDNKKVYLKGNDTFKLSRNPNASRENGKNSMDITISRLQRISCSTATPLSDETIEWINRVRKIKKL